MKIGCTLSSEEFLKNLKIMDTEEELTLETKLEDLTDWDSFSLTAFFIILRRTYETPD